jgi:hypothetical protein
MRHEPGRSGAVPVLLTRLEEDAVAELTADDLREIEDAQVTAKGARYSEAQERMIDR